MALGFYNPQLCSFETSSVPTSFLIVLFFEVIKLECDLELFMSLFKDLSSSLVDHKSQRSQSFSHDNLLIIVSWCSHAWLSFFFSHLMLVTIWSMNFITVSSTDSACIDFHYISSFKLPSVYHIFCSIEVRIASLVCNFSFIFSSTIEGCLHMDLILSSRLSTLSNNSALSSW